MAASLNTIDASITLASWDYEINPLVLTAGPTLFIAAKIFCSIAIVLFARSATDPRRGGRILTGAFALILAWNLGQLALSNFRFGSMALALFWGTVSSMAVALATFMALALRRGRAQLS
jgi:hypothetical protein